MEELRLAYAEKNNAFRKKYEKVIYDIAMARGVDLGIGFDMLKATARGGNYCDGIDVDLEELKKDYYEIACISEEIARMSGMI